MLVIAVMQSDHMLIDQVSCLSLTVPLFTKQFHISSDIVTVDVLH